MYFFIKNKKIIKTNYIGYFKGSFNVLLLKKKHYKKTN
jgi:hypothetical protein